MKFSKVLALVLIKIYFLLKSILFSLHPFLYWLVWNSIKVNLIDSGSTIKSFELIVLIKMIRYDINAESLIQVTSCFFLFFASIFVLVWLSPNTWWPSMTRPKSIRLINYFMNRFKLMSTTFLFVITSAIHLFLVSGFVCFLSEIGTMSMLKEISFDAQLRGWEKVLKGIGMDRLFTCSAHCRKKNGFQCLNTIWSSYLTVLNVLRHCERAIM